MNISLNTDWFMLGTFSSDGKFKKKTKKKCLNKKNVKILNETKTRKNC